MKIILPDNSELDLIIDKKSSRVRKVMGDHNLTLYFDYPDYINIPVGSYVDYEAQRYTLLREQDFKKNNTRNFSYTLTLDSEQGKLKRYKHRDLSRKLKFSLTAKPHEHIELLVNNLNLKDSGWSVGECIDSPTKVVTFSHNFCDDALQMIADAFNTEWEIVGKTINLRKVEYFKDSPLALSYGKGKGFKPGLGRYTPLDKKAVSTLYAEGGSRNIDPSKYGSNELLLPKIQQWTYEGRTYESDADGYSIRRIDKPATFIQEDSIDLTHIYPMREGTVSKVEVVDKDKNFYDFFDSSIPADLDYSKLRQDGEKITIEFQEGMLTGKVFEIEQSDTSVTGYIHAERRFKLVPQEIDGQTMPNDAFKPEVGQKYSVFGIQLPDAYVCDNTTKTGASWEMFKEAAKYLYENENQPFVFEGVLDGLWAKKRWLAVGGHIKPGAYIQFSDDQFQTEGVNVRITGVTDYVVNPHSPILELSNAPIGSSVASDLIKLENTEVIIDNAYNDAISFTKRRYRDAIETSEMLANALLKNFTDSINPITVHTMQVLLGDESLQYRFVNNKTNPTTVSHVITYNDETKILKCPAGIIQHMTLGIKDISSKHNVSEYKFWDIALYNSPPLTDTTAYYLYLKVSKTNTTGTFLLSKTAIEMESVTGFYHLLVGILNSEFDGTRSFVELYGFTEILPGRITTDRVVSSDGLNFLDFVNNAFRVGNSTNYLEWNKNGNGKLILKGTIVQSGSGDEAPIGCFRGEYNSSYVYYNGDEVTYEGSTYRYINSYPFYNVPPTNTAFWTVIASKGETGSYKSFVFKQSETQPAKPTGTTAIPSGWTDAPTSDGIWWMSNATITYTNGQWISGAWSVPVKVTGEDGEAGADGKFWDYKYRVAATKPTKPSGLNPSGWTDAPPQVTTGMFLWMSYCEKNAGQTAIITDWTDPVQISGEKGQTGDYFEYRYAKNGSTTNYPTPFNASLPNAGGSNWTLSMPSVGQLEYLWMTSCKKDTSGNLIVNWSTPVRVKGVDGIDGKDGIDGTDGDAGPSVVYRGIFDTSKTYYGNSKRVDAVKYNVDGQYYIARIDAGEFSGNSYNPHDGTKWNSFGAQFESVATNLLLAEMANIGDWIIKNGKITSQNSISNGDPCAQLDGVNGGISFASEESVYTQYNGTETTTKSIKISSQLGRIDVQNDKGHLSYLSTQGVYGNRAGIDVVSATTGALGLKASVAGMGIGNMDANYWGTNIGICGVFGTATNNAANPAPSFGGYFRKLMAEGLFFKTTVYNDSNFNADSHQYVSETDTYIVGDNATKEGTIVLPSNSYKGRILFIRSANNAKLNIRAYNNTTALIYTNQALAWNTYYEVGRGYLAILTYATGYWNLNRLGF